MLGGSERDRWWNDVRGVVAFGPARGRFWGTWRTHRLAQNSPALCARFWKGNVPLDLLKSALGGLNDTELDHYAALLVKAGTPALEQGSPSAPAPGNTEKAFAQITSQLPVAEQSSFLADIGRSDLTDERACALFKTMFEGSQKLEPSLRTDLYRGLAQQR